MIKQENKPKEDESIHHQSNVVILPNQNSVGNPFFNENSLIGRPFHPPQSLFMPLMNPWFFPFIF